MDLFLMLALGLVLGLGIRTFLTTTKKTEQGNVNSVNDLTQGISRLIRSLPNIVIWMDADNKVKYASENTISSNIVRDERIQVEAIESIVNAVRKINNPILKDVKARRPLGISQLNLTVWALKLERGDVLVWAQDNTVLGRIEAVRRDFVVNISHELKTPVGALSLLAEAIEEADDDTETVKKFAKRIGPETKRLTNVIRDIIDLSQVQADDPLASASIVDVDRVINDSVDAVQLLADLQNIEIYKVNAPGVKIVGDHYQLVMAARNLLTNAITFSQPSSRITIGAKLIGNVIEITVSDQGTGISLEDQGRVFERFYRVDPARSREKGGTGLGLAIVKHVCENHGGEVTVWSVPGQGSTFTMKFPKINEGSKAETSQEMKS